MFITLNKYLNLKRLTMFDNMVVLPCELEEEFKLFSKKYNNTKLSHNALRLVFLHSYVSEHLALLQFNVNEEHDSLTWVTVVIDDVVLCGAILSLLNMTKYENQHTKFCVSVDVKGTSMILNIYTADSVWDRVNDSDLLGRAYDNYTHDYVKMFVNDGKDPIDFGMNGIITKLHKLSIETNFCCVGHPFGFYISMESDDIDLLTKLRDATIPKGFKWDSADVSRFQTVRFDEELMSESMHRNMFSTDGTLTTFYYRDKKLLELANILKELIVYKLLSCL